jgi:hypothetical protein
MTTIAGSGNSTINRTGGERQVAIANLDTTNALNAKINGDPTGQTLEANGRRGWRINTGIYVVQIAATGSWEVSFSV